MEYSEPSVLEVVVQDLGCSPTLTAACAGFDRGEWRAEALADEIIDWIPEWALTYSQRQLFSGGRLAVPLMRRAFHNVYNSPRYKRRGEAGEILLHILLCHVFGTEPAISKIYYKDAANDTVKGFDAVHVSVAEDGLDLWLGEVKFYASLSRAIYDVAAELTEHLGDGYLRGEFVAITNKLDSVWPHAELLRLLIHRKTRLQHIFKRVCIPVLLTYESPSIGSHIARLPSCQEDEDEDEFLEEYKTNIEAEVRKGLASFMGRCPASNVRVHLILLPMHQKRALTKALHDKLQYWQKLLPA